MGFKLLWLSLAGALGTLARYGLAGLVQQLFKGQFPWGTLTVNMLGCFVFGFIWELTEQKMLLSSETRQMILIGFIGSFTTFSAFLFETDQMLEHSQWLLAALNVTGELGLGILFYLIGAFLGRFI